MSEPASVTDAARAESIRRLAATLSESVATLKAIRITRGSGVPGVDLPTIQLLLRLAERDLSVGEAASGLCNDMSTVSRQVTHLVRAGLATKSHDPHDRRSVRVSLTDAGHEAVDAVLRVRCEWLAELLDGWSDTDLETFSSYLQRLADAASAATR